MVDIRTILHLATLGVPLGERLGQDGCELAAWTLHAETESRALVARRLFELGVTTIITDAPLVVANDFVEAVL
jgi:glycerophosphoryl diester phosphodiesterase